MKIETQKLLSLLESLAPGLSSRGLQEQGNCFIFTEKSIITYNGEVSCRCPSPVLSVKGAVPADALLSVLRKLTVEKIEVSMTSSELVIEGGSRRKITIVMADTILLPVNTVPRVKEWAVLDDTWCEGAKMVNRCCGVDESEYVMTCVHIDSEYLEASDNYQVGRYRVDTPVPETLVRGEHLRKALTIHPDNISRSEAWLHFKNKNRIEIAVRCDDQPYPDLKMYLRVKGDQFSFPKRAAREAIDIASVILNLDESQDPFVRADLKPGELKITSSSVAGSSMQLMKASDYTGPELSFMIHPELLAELVERQKQKCTIGQGRLLVRDEQFTYVTCTAEIQE